MQNYKQLNFKLKLKFHRWLSYIDEAPSVVGFISVSKEGKAVVSAWTKDISGSSTGVGTSLVASKFAYKKFTLVVQTSVVMINYIKLRNIIEVNIVIAYLS